ncbi:MAG TPA: alpha-glucan family phosphorylase, partial [Bacteroidia bacterium]|nr:alpha-glucan family phosphorylase [Bacteroidia bacterium]
MISKDEIFGYQPNPKYKKPVAYFSMEFAIDQALKIYSGGLGFLAGSHMRSAYELKQNIIGIGMLWKNGYYDQSREINDDM